MEKKIYVINLRGEKEPFSFRKVFQSARNVGASKEVAFEIAKQIEKEIFPGISTSQIFDRIFELLLEKSPSSAIKFNLKKAMEKLGPTGYPFEKFIGKVFEAENFKTKNNVFILGASKVNYEIDFLAQKKNLIYVGECKFRHERGGRVDLQVALANYARFLDIKKGKFLNSRSRQKSILVTNAKFTTEAIKYSKYVGVELLGWKYPFGRGLEKLIEKNKLFPVTILPSCSSRIAKILIQYGIVLVKDVFKENFIRLKISKKRQILREAELLLQK
jgi:hypothetical protein